MILRQGDQVSKGPRPAVRAIPLVSASHEGKPTEGCLTEYVFVFVFVCVCARAHIHAWLQGPSDNTKSSTLVTVASVVGKLQGAVQFRGGGGSTPPPPHWC